ncbi:restriction endonuclease subunit S [Vibrio fluvialis]|uniref:restriction endonuclease subunit S n=1 Tax=Vibrio fluvialis TaxID=676 RepID=UPI0028F730AE|nr:restriction endonuclease subunit S [Vibrio fluvialis]
MSGKYAAYPEYKDSDVEWLDTVPSHWNMFNGKRVFCSVRRKALSSDEQLAASQKFGVVPQSLMMELNDAKVMLALKGTDSFRHVEKDNFVISLRSFEGGIEHSAYVGCVSPAYTVLEATKNVSARYYKYLLKSKPYIAALQASTDSLRDGKSISFEQFSNIWLPLFEVDEQTQIANFLDHETAKIDTLIEKQQQLIKLLKEKRQAVISHAVTKGLNPQAPMKDSGVEWFDAVPLHWKIMELKFSAADGYKTFTDGDWIESPYITDSGVRLLQTGNVGIGEFKEKGFRYISESSFKKLNCTEVKPNDVLICRLDGPVGRSCLAPDLGVKVITSVDNAILKTHRDFDARFIVYLTNSTPWLRWIQDLCRVGGGFRLRISRTMLGEQRIPVPPLDEQILIADMLDELSDKHLRCIEQAEKSIVLLKERRTSLISAVVTGKMDVRNWQRNRSTSEDECSDAV